MKMRCLILLSLFLVSILVISGCQYSAVGGVNGAGQKTIYTATDSSYTLESYNSNDFVKIKINVRDTCTEQSSLSKGQYVLTGNRCFEVMGCIVMDVASMGRSQVAPPKETPILRESSISIPCYQNKAVDISGSPYDAFFIPKN